MAQFRPSENMGNGSKVVQTAAMSDPTNIVPVCSIVTDTKIGISRPAVRSINNHRNQYCKFIFHQTTVAI